MEIRYAVVADSANISREGKANITGIFDRVNVVQFPAGHAGACLVVAVEAHPSESGQHPVKITFADADGIRLSSTEFSINVPANADPGLPVRGTHVLPIPLIPFPHPGDYSFDIFIDGRYQTSIPVTAVQTDQAPA